jgi:predicted nuclease with TOPRIM domain
MIDKWGYINRYSEAAEVREAFTETRNALKECRVEVERLTDQYHLAHAKVLSREAIIEQLSETELAKDVVRLEAEVERLRERYNELIYAVVHKYEGETRHETALRYIQNAEITSGPIKEEPSDD